MSLAERVLKYFSNDMAETLKPRGLARRLGSSKSERQEYEAVIEQMLDDGRLQRSPQGHVLAPGMTEVSRGLIRGKVKRTATGGAWITPEPPPGGWPDLDRAPQELYLEGDALRDAQNGDVVLVRPISNRGRSGRQFGRIEQVLERATHTFVGSYFEDEGLGQVRIDGRHFPLPVDVGDPGAKGAIPGDKVVIEMVRFPTPTRPGEAVLVRVLGAAGEPGVDEQTIVTELGLPDEFPEEVLDEARQQAEQFSEDDLTGRLDLTGETIVTIDPIDARDFDDAISLSQSEDGHWHLGVHIADVAHFVPVGSKLDDEAKRRGTSVYLPGRVIPMLPETISNSLASLQQGHVRYTKSALIEFSPEGVPLHTSLRNSAIRVTRRFAYEQVLPILDHPSKARDQVGPKVRGLLERMRELGRLLRGRRFEQGAIELYLPEVKLELGRKGEVVGVRQSVSDESHQIIEEFMLAANMAVARELSKRKVRFLRRVHADPDSSKLEAFAHFIECLGFPSGKYWTRAGQQQILAAVKGQLLEQAVNFAMLRSMKQAEYSPAVLGHYALAAPDYCHFTSPIRRYPDLTVHRLVDHLIRSQGDSAAAELDSQQVQAQQSAHESDTPRPRKASARKTKASKSTDSESGHNDMAAFGPGPEEAIQLGAWCSGTERRAATAERDLVRIKLLRLMATKRDEVFDVIITGVEKFGVFCKGEEFPIDGFIPVEQLANGEYLEYDRRTWTLCSRRGRNFRMGDRLRVRVRKVDPEERTLEWQLVTDEPVTALRLDKLRRNTAGRKRSAIPAVTPTEPPPKGRRAKKATEVAPPEKAKRNSRAERKKKSQDRKTKR